MRNVRITKTIRIRLTADDWQLYGHEGDVARDMAAFEMNAKIENMLNAHPTRTEAAQALGTILNEYSSFGAADSEGYAVASDLFDVFFNQEESK